MWRACKVFAGVLVSSSDLTFLRKRRIVTVDLCIYFRNKAVEKSFLLNIPEC